MEVFALKEIVATQAAGKWLFPAQLRQLAFCSAHKRIIESAFPYTPKGPTKFRIALP
jgi:hypothetical protein